MNSDILNNFKSYLTSKSSVNEKYAPYYVRWVSSCYAFVNQSLSGSLTNGQKQDFHKHFAKNHEGWQGKQAEAALRLYDFYLSGLQMSIKEESVENKVKWGVVETKAQNVMRLKHMSYSTEKTYLMWLRSFQGFASVKSPDDLAAEDIQRFLSYLAVQRKVSTSTQNQALNAIVFVYRHVFEKDIEDQINSVKTRQKRRLPVVLSVKEVNNNDIL